MLNYGGVGGGTFGGAGTVIAGTASLTGGTIANVTTSGTLEGVTQAGQGLAVIVARGRSAAQTAAVASICTFTVGAADASFEVAANLLITASTTFQIFVSATYTDEGNTARTMNLSLIALGGAATTNAGNAAGAVPYASCPQMIRCKAGTVITLLTSGTFTTVTYNVEGVIKQVATT